MDGVLLLALYIQHMSDSDVFSLTLSMFIYVHMAAAENTKMPGHTDFPNPTINLTYECLEGPIDPCQQEKYGL